MAIKVKLRQKLITKGRKCLYLDFHPAIENPETGKETRREFLGLYVFIDKNEFKKEVKACKQRDLNSEKGKIIKATKKRIEVLKTLKPLTPIDKHHNIETLKIAESIRQKRENFLNKPEIYSQYEKEQLKIKEMGEKDFVEYFRRLADKRQSSNHDNWVSALNYLENFTNGSLKFADINEEKINGFKDYLLNTKSNKSNKTKLAQNSAVSYFNKIKAALKQAFKDGYLQTDLNAKVASIKQAETRKEYLTLEELNLLVKTPCNNPLLKRAALFSSLTGMRFSDIQKLIWDEVEYIKGEGYVINFQQKKTKGIEVLPVSEQAYSFMGEPRKADDKVFEGLQYSAYHNKHLYQWIGAAGITKDITFHCFRHTFATLQLFGGTDIYTVSKMLGHKDLKTTQIYAKIVDEAKREAANKIKLSL